VTAGSGEVQTLSAAEGFRTFPLEPGAVVWFSPGVVHRLVNRAGWKSSSSCRTRAARSGRFRPHFPIGRAGGPGPVRGGGRPLPPAARLHPHGRVARRRRDLAIEGFTYWRKRRETEGPGGLDDLYRAAVSIIGRRSGRGRVSGSAARRRRRRRRRSNWPHCVWGRDASAGGTGGITPVPGPDRKLGMCGMAWPVSAGGSNHRMSAKRSGCGRFTWASAARMVAD